MDQVIREQKFESVDAITSYLSQAPVASMLDTNILDPGIGKYFILSQLAIQYLLFCKKFLDETVTTLRESLCESQLDNANLKKLNHENNNELLQLHKKFQQMETINEVVFPCSLCTKNFISNDMLNTHMKRKHGKNDEPDTASRDKDRNLINAIKLELEIKQLKERLNVAEKSIKEKSAASPITEGNSIGIQIENRNEMKNIGIQSNLEEPKEKDEEEFRKSEILSELHGKLSEFEHWKEEEKLNNVKNLTMLDDLQQKLQTVVETIDERTKMDEELLKSIVSNALASVPRSVESSDKSNSPRIEDFQKILTETVSKLNEKNSEQLNEVVKKIQHSYEEKLSALQVEIHKQNEHLAKSVVLKDKEVQGLILNNVKSVLPKEKEVFVKVAQKTEESRKKGKEEVQSFNPKNNKGLTTVEKERKELEKDSIAQKTKDESKILDKRMDTKKDTSNLLKAFEGEHKIEQIVKLTSFQQTKIPKRIVPSVKKNLKMMKTLKLQSFPNPNPNPQNHKQLQRRLSRKRSPSSGVIQFIWQRSNTNP